MINRNIKKYKKLFVLIIAFLMLYVVLANNEDVVLKNFYTVIAIPIMFVLFNSSFEEFLKYNDTLKLAEENQKLFDLKIINEKEFMYRRNLIIELENKSVELNHSEMKDSNEIKEYFNNVE